MVGVRLFVCFPFFFPIGKQWVLSDDFILFCGYFNINMNEYRMMIDLFWFSFVGIFFSKKKIPKNPKIIDHRKSENIFSHSLSLHSGDKWNVTSFFFVFGPKKKFFHLIFTHTHLTMINQSIIQLGKNSGKKILWIQS